MSKLNCTFLISLLLISYPCHGVESDPQRYDVVWNTPSADHTGSVPLGNGSTGLNAWIEENGDLVFYISRGDSWAEDMTLLKLGKVRITLDPKPSTTPFKQVLSLADGTLLAQYGNTQVRVWVDAHHSVIHAEVHSDQAIRARAGIELWRIENPFPTHPEKKAKVHDIILKNQQGRIGWYHRNPSSVIPHISEIEGVTGFERVDPLLHRTFGVVITADGAEHINDTTLLSPPSKQHRFDIYTATKHPATETQWLAEIDRLIKETKAIDFAQRRSAHETWWNTFWERSWIHAGDATSTSENEAKKVSRGYALQRYINACGGKGPYPIKFNGAIFTVPNQEKGKNDPDFRAWGPKYTWQNTRLPYYSMCASGDIELTEPLFQMYCRDLFEYMKYQTQVHTGHKGIYIPENIYFSGDMPLGTYGKKPCSERTDKLQTNPWHKWEWVSGLELSFLMFERYAFTEDEAFLHDTLLPFAHEILTFFDLQYQAGSDGKLVMHPAQACELYRNCTNPMPEIAGLHAISDRLLALPERLTTPAQRTYWKSVKDKVPEIPTHVYKGKTMLAPAGKFDKFNNREAPEFYATFPFRHIAVGKPNIELGIEALPYLNPELQGWRQNDIQMAYLGQAKEAKANIINRVNNVNVESRFPAFWGPNYDWTPDQCHGGVIMKTFQSMIMQADEKKIYIMPAWPKDWNVDFKLHAPHKTVVKGQIKNGQLVDLDVTPASRKKDVIIMDAQ